MRTLARVVVCVKLSFLLLKQHVHDATVGVIDVLPNFVSKLVTRIGNVPWRTLNLLGLWTTLFQKLSVY